MLYVSKIIKRFGFATVFVFALSACGGSSSSSSSGDGTTDSTPATNVALASAGATVSSTFSGNETFVNDGDTGNTNFWEPGADGDSITIEFDEVYDVEFLEISSMNLNSNSEFAIAFSGNGVTFTDIDLVLDCLSFSIGASGYSCELVTPIEAGFIRLTILMDSANIDIYEIEVFGT